MRGKGKEKRSFNQEDVDYAADLVKQGLLPRGSDMDRVMRALDKSNVSNLPSNSRPGSRGNTSTSNVLPRNWSEAKRINAEKNKSRSVPVNAKEKQRPTTAPINVTASKPRKGLYTAPGKKKSKAFPGNPGTDTIHGTAPADTVTASSTEKEKRSTFTPSSTRWASVGQRPLLSNLSPKARAVAEARGVAQGRLVCQLLTDDIVDVAYVRYALRCAAGLTAEQDHADVSHLAANWASRDSAILMDGPAVRVDQPGVSLLHQAASRDLPRVAAALIEYGAEVNRVNRWAETPLHWAAAANSYHTATLLLDFGADVTANDASGSCPLLRAAHGGHLEVISLLLSRARGAISANKLRMTLKIARNAIEADQKINGTTSTDEKAAKEAALVLIQRHLRLLKEEDKQQPLAQAAVSSPVKDITASAQLVAQLQEAMEAQVIALTSAPPVGIEDSVVVSEVGDEDGSAMEAEIIRLAEQCEALREVPGTADAAVSAFPVPAAAAQSPDDAIKQKRTPVVVINAPTDKKGKGAEKKEKGKEKPKENDTQDVLPLSAVVPLKNTASKSKYAAATYVPFLHSAMALGGAALGTSCEVGDVLLTVEQCFNCEEHNFSLWHDSLKYSSVADRCLIALVRSLLDRGFRIRLFALKEVPRAARIGALEISCAVCVQPGVGNASSTAQWVTHTLHSKLETSSWPSVKRVAASGAAFVQWVLQSRNLVEHLPVGSAVSPRGLPLQRALKESLELGGSESSDAPVNPPVAIESAEGMPGSAVKKLQVEGQFMSWLIRLSMSSATATSPLPKKHKGKKSKKGADVENNACAADSIVNGGMQTLEEWTKRNIASFGPFFCIQSRLGSATSTFPSSTAVVAAGAPSSAQKGKRGQEIAEASTPFGSALSLARFEQLSLSHFFVYDNIKSAKTASASVKEDKEEVSETEKGRAAPSNGDVQKRQSPERAVAEKLVKDVSSAATLSVSAQSSPVPVKAVSFAPEVTQSQTKPEPTSASARHAIDDRVEGNYRRAGTWYKGVIVAVGKGSEGNSEYDILYDDDEMETGLSADLVRAVVRKPFASRLLLSTSPEAAALAPQGTADVAEDAEDEAEDLEESIQYEVGTPVRDSRLSPATPQSADSDSLVLSLSAEN